MPQGSHERLDRPEEFGQSSDRVFGFIFTGVFCVVGLFPLVRSEPPRVAALGVAAAFLVLALTVPWVLAPLNRTWMRFGAVANRVVNPIILGLMFLVAVTPVALVMRLIGKDPLSRKFDPSAETYWITREDAGPPAENMRDQF